MKFSTSLLLALFTSSTTFAAPVLNPIANRQLHCVNELSTDTWNFLENFKTQQLLLGTADGLEYHLSVQVNELGIPTARLVYPKQRGTQENMPLFECEESNGSLRYVLAYADRHSPVGMYRYELLILIPLNLETQSFPLRSFVDLRTGLWDSAVMIFN